MKIEDRTKPSSLASKSGASTKGKPVPPPNYKVILEIDHNAPLEFVEQVVLRVFAVSRNSLAKLREALLNGGRAECGLFVREIAETKAAEVMSLAADNEYELECFIEKSD